MKLFNSKEDSLYLSRKQWTKLFAAFSIMVILLYVGAMIASLCGSQYFILNFQNEQMERIEAFLTQFRIMPLLNYVFSTIEFTIILAFILKRIPKWYYIIFFYAFRVMLAFIVRLPSTFNTLYILLFSILLFQLSNNLSINITLKKSSVGRNIYSAY